MMSEKLRDISFGLLGLLTLALVAATIVGKTCGSGEAMRLVYHAPWAIVMWIVMAVVAAAYIWRRRPAMSLPAFAIHLSLFVILAGAGVSFLSGRQGKLTLRSGDRPERSFIADDGERINLPFQISLRESRIDYYPGTSSAMDYVSELEIMADGVSRHETVAMNKVLEIDGYRFYQTALGADYSTLSVSHDPLGIAVSYTGYGLLILSIILFFFFPHTRFRLLLRRVVAVPVLILTGVVQMHAADGGRELPQTLQKPLAANFGRLYAYWGGRVVPLQTVARDFCMKLYGRDSYRGLTAEQVLTGWLFYYDDWKNEPMIRIKGDKVIKLLGAEGKYVSLMDFYGNGGYKLDGIGREGLADRNLLSADEKAGLVSRICTGRDIKIIPVKPGGNTATEWYSWVDRLPPETDVEVMAAFTSGMEFVAREIAHGRFNSANEMLWKLRGKQIEIAGADNLPSDLRFMSERLYNRIAMPWLPAMLALAGGMFAFFFPRRRIEVLVVAVAVFIYLTVVMALQWIVGGHLPMSNGYETMQTMAWISLSTTLLLFRRIPLLRPLGLLVGGLALIVAALGESNPSVSPLIPVLASPLLSLHVMLVMSSYALFAMMMLDSVTAFFKRSDAAEVTRLADLSALLLYPAVFALGAGIFIGAVWANQSWGRYWGWDPKETWALITFIIYAFPLHSSSFPVLRKARSVHVYFFFAFMSVLMTYFGVNYLLSGLHSYAVG
ncbi:MAG: cytochrome c biogenesis protein CcsA [Staphylococcus sp.]|nr:cytochrome c biogenesis protein CcsA [Staphylococcus sp.]